MSSIALPEEVTLQILIRLPSTPLIRFRSVCKSWCSMISSPSFISAHANENCTPTNSNLLLRRFCRNQEREVYTLHDENNEYNTIGEFAFPFKPQNPQPYFKIIGCVRGLICLWGGYYKYSCNPSIILWNPAIHKYFSLPCRTDIKLVDRLFLNRRFSFGFGYDAFSDDYKFLRLTYKYYCTMTNRMALLPSVVIAEVFSLRNRIWRRVSDSVPRNLLQISIPIFLNGSLHWLTRNDANYVVVTFGLEAENFGEMVCPREIEIASRLNHKIVVSRGSLSLLHQGCGNHYDIWMMKEYGVAESWTKVYSIMLDVFPERKSLLGFSKSGGLVVIGHGSWVGSPGLENLQIVDFHPPGRYTVPHIELYVESLVLLDEEDNDSAPLELIKSADGSDEKVDNKRRWWESDCSTGSYKRGKRLSFASVHQFCPPDFRFLRR